MSDAEIKHDTNAHRYSLVIDGTEAYLTYERPAKRELGTEKCSSHREKSVSRSTS